MTPQEAGSIGGNRGVARHGGYAVAQRAYQGQLARWGRMVDAEATARGEVLTPQDRALRIAYAQRAHCAKMRAARKPR